MFDFFKTYRLSAAIALAVAGLSAQAADRPQALSQFFRTCTPDHDSLEGALMRSVWDKKVRKEFPDAQREKATGLRFAPDALEPGYLEATVDLVRPAPIAGVRPVRLSATTCEEGCGLSTWVLEFGNVPRSKRPALRAWVRQAPGREWDLEVLHGRLKPQLFERKDGTVALICDPST